MSWEEYTKDSLETHSDRAKFFLVCGLNSRSELEAERCFIASIYFCRAQFEIMVTRAKNEEIDIDPPILFQDAEENVRHFKIIEAARVQDFHRTAIRFHSGGVMMAGPISIKAGPQAGSSASFSVTANGDRVQKTKRNSSIKLNRPLQVHGFSIYSEVLDKPIPVTTIIDEYLIDMDEFVKRNNRKKNP